MFIHVHNVVLLRGLPSLEGKHKLFVRKKEEKKVIHAWVRQTIAIQASSAW